MMYKNRNDETIIFPLGSIYFCGVSFAFGLWKFSFIYLKCLLSAKIGFWNNWIGKLFSLFLLSFLHTDYIAIEIT